MFIRTLAVSALLALFACSGAFAAPITVNLRVEGAERTIYEGPVTTDVREVDGHDGTGPHTCDGTNAGANPSPGPTFLGAFADAADASGFDWLGVWEKFGFQEEFSLDRVEEDSADSSHYWAQLIGYRSNQVGGCQQRIQAGDDLQVLYLPFDSQTFASPPALRMQGAPAAVAVGESFTVTVDEHDGFSPPVPAEGATVEGRTTGDDGRATISFDSPGVRRFKATRENAIRSNAAVVCVYAPGSGACSTGRAPGVAAPPAADTTAPRAIVSSVRDGRRYRRPPRTLAGRVEEEAGIHQVYVRLRMIGRGGCRWLSGSRETFTRPRTCARARYIRVGQNADWSYLLPLRLPAGARYILDVKVLDRALNRDLEQVRFSVAR